MSDKVRDKDYKKMFNVLSSAVRVIKPSLTQEQAENVIINVANYMQLIRLQEGREKYEK
jgi:hypothetical protein